MRVVFENCPVLSPIHEVIQQVSKEQIFNEINNEVQNLVTQFQRFNRDFDEFEAIEHFSERPFNFEVRQNNKI